MRQWEPTVVRSEHHDGARGELLRVRFAPLIFQLPPSSLARSTRGSDIRLARYPGSTRIKTGLSSSFAGMNVTDLGGALDASSG